VKDRDSCDCKLGKILNLSKEIPVYGVDFLSAPCVCQGELKGSQLYKKLLEDAQNYYKSSVWSSTLVVSVLFLYH